MNDFNKNDEYWSIDVYLEKGTVFSVEKDSYGIMHDPNWDRKRGFVGKTKEECINKMISELENLRDFPSEY
ncbi:TPA: hypothetical protein ACU9OW_000012 [Legionella pneumophila]